MELVKIAEQGCDARDNFALNIASILVTNGDFMSMREIEEDYMMAIGELPPSEGEIELALYRLNHQMVVVYDAETDEWVHLVVKILETETVGGEKRWCLR